MDSIQFVIRVVVGAISLYAGYWGIAISRGLVLRDYKNQALGLTSIAWYFAAGWFIGNFFGGVISSYSVVLLAVFSISSNIPLFIWIDFTARVARRSDPYERDTLHWSVTKYFLVAGLIIVGAIILSEAPITVIYGLGVGVPSNTVPLIYQILGLGQYLALAVVAFVLISLSAIRSKDRTLQKHLRWFALFPVAVFATLVELGFFNYFFSGTVQGSLGNEISGYLVDLFLGFGGFCLYKSARSLAPTTNRFAVSYLKSKK